VNTPPVGQLASSEAIRQRDTTDLKANVAVLQQFLTHHRSTCDYDRILEGAAVGYEYLLSAQANLRLDSSQAKKIVSRIACSFDESGPVPNVGGDIGPEDQNDDRVRAHFSPEGFEAA